MQPVLKLTQHLSDGVQIKITFRYKWRMVEGKSIFVLVVSLFDNTELTVLKAIKDMTTLPKLYWAVFFIPCDGSPTTCRSTLVLYASTLSIGHNWKHWKNPWSYHTATTITFTLSFFFNYLMALQILRSEQPNSIFNRLESFIHNPLPAKWETQYFSIVGKQTQDTLLRGTGPN